MAGTVSVIIPAYNRCAELVECLRSLHGQTYADRETIVVDDGSDDGTAERVAAAFPTVRVIGTPGRCGPAHARNLGLRAAHGEFVLFLDSDTEFPDDGAIARMVAALENDPSIGLIGGEIPVSSGRRDEAYGRKVGLNGASRRAVARPGQAAACAYLATCNCLGRRSVLERAGGFDPYYVFGAEDQDLGSRVRALGLRCVVSCETAVVHKQSPRGRNEDETARYHRTRVRFQFKLAGGLRLAAGFLLDLAHALFFYCVLSLKLAVKLARRRNLRRENFTGGWLLLKAYWLNLIGLGETRRCRNADFLSDEEIARFEQWRAERKT